MSNATFPRAGFPRASLLSFALLLAFQAHAQDAGANAAPDAQATDTTSAGTEATDLDRVLVVAQRAGRVSNGATNLDLDIKDTPQSIRVVSSGQMQAFGANSVNDALRLATGIQVEEWETNRTNYLSRGFEIENTQVDGVGLPNDWGIATGATDSYGYDKIEVIRGANGLLTGVGNAAGTINYVRKRPTNERQGMLGISYFAMTQLEAAVERPPHLRAIFPVAATTDLYEAASHHGLTSSSFITPFLAMMGLTSQRSDAFWRHNPLLAAARRVLNLPQVHARFATMNGEAAVTMMRQLLKLPHQPHPWDDLWLDTMVRHPVRDDWWEERNLLPLMGGVDIPVYLGCDWENVPLHLPSTFTAWKALQHNANVRMAMLGQPWRRATPSPRPSPARCGRGGFAVPSMPDGSRRRSELERTSTRYRFGSAPGGPSASQAAG